MLKWRDLETTWSLSSLEYELQQTQTQGYISQYTTQLEHLLTQAIVFDTSHEVRALAAVLTPWLCENRGI